MKVHYEKFKWNLEPLRIVFFADLHAGSRFIDLSYIEKLVQTVNHEQPDMVLIGGDFVSEGLFADASIPFHEVSTQLAKIKSKYGIFTVLGNAVPEVVVIDCGNQ